MESLKVYVSWCKPESSFLLGIDFNKGTGENIDTKETMEVSVLSIGFLVFEVNFIW